MIRGRRVVVVEDQPLTRSLLAEVLQGHGFDVATAEDALGGRKAVDDFDPDVALIDVGLGVGPTGLDLARALRSERPDIAILILTQHTDPRAAGLALPDGCGYIRKDNIADPGILLAALDAVLGDRPQDYRHDLDPTRPLAQLTTSQMDVLRLAALGYTNAAIARERGTSEGGVELAFTAIFKALGIPRDGDINPRVEAVRRYVEAAGLPARPE